jgi:hypothetical protein
LYEDDCKTWKPTVNTSKSKTVVFSKGRQQNYAIILNNEILEVVTEYKYLEVLFCKSGSYTLKLKCTKHYKLLEQCIV